jgi:hypothetical protein
MADNTVTTPKISNQAVTMSKLSPEVGIVPSGFKILGDSPLQPAGYTFSGTFLKTDTPIDAWITRASPARNPLWASAAAIGNKIYMIGGMYFNTIIYNFVNTNANRAYDLTTNTWTDPCVPQ